MNGFFRRLSLPLKLLLVVLVPLSLLVYLTIQVYNEKAHKVQLISGYLERIRQAGHISTLIDELQAERRFSYEYALQKKWYRELLEQRIRTDLTTRELERHADEYLAKFPNYTFLKDLPEIRARIDTGNLAPDEVMQYYTLVIFRLNSLNNISAGHNVYLQPVNDELQAQKLLSEMVTHMGSIRSHIYNVLYTRSGGLSILYGLTGTYDIYNSFEAELLAKASRPVDSAYKSFRLNGSLNKVMDYLAERFRTMSFDTTYSADEWWRLSAEGIDELRNLQMGLLKSVEQKTAAIYEREKISRNRTLVYLIVALVLLLLLMTYTISVITRMLSELKLAAEKIAKGAPGGNIRIDSPDAIGSLASSISGIDRNSQELAVAANAIGKGRFDVSVQPRSSGDVLGNAIMRMKENLQQITGEIAESREQFRQLADFVPQIVFTTTAEGVTDYYNKQWYEFTGLSRQASGKGWNEILHPDDREPVLQAWQQSVRSGRPFEKEYRFRDGRTGQYRWFLGRAVPVRDKDGKISKWFGTCTDIHGSKSMSEMLESLVRQRTLELERSNDDLQQFAHVASHDLKEPLRKIKTFGNLFQQQYGHSLPDKAKGYIEKIQGSVDRMWAMVEGVLNYSQVSATELIPEKIDLNELIRDIANDLELLISQKKARIEFSDLDAVGGIPVLIYQLFYNLINNALKFSRPEVSPVVAIWTDRVRGEAIRNWPQADPEGEYVCVQVSDNGIGFPAEMADKVFHIFTRLNPRDQFEGTGLGLALCKKIVLRHGGHITATGRDGNGANFTVYLPALDHGVTGSQRNTDHSLL